MTLESYTDLELISISEECLKTTWDSDSIIRTLAKEYFGNDSLISIMGLGLKVLPVIAERLKLKYEVYNK